MLYLGRVMELGEAETVFTAPHHPYTEALLSSVPQIDGLERPRIRLEGEIPTHADPPSGCVFHTRCPRFIGDICVNEEPPLREVEPDHLWRCHHSIEDAPRDAEDRPAERAQNGGTSGGGCEPRRGRGRSSRSRHRAGRRQAARRPEPGRGNRADAAGREHALRVRAAVLERTGAPLEVVELDLAPPGPGEVLVRLRAGGVCHSDLNAIDGTAETRCPAVLGHEGAGVVEAVGEGVGLAAGHARGALVAAGLRRRARSACASLAASVHRRPGTRWTRGGLLDGTPRLSRDGERRLPLLAAVDVRRARRRPRALLHPDARRRAVRRRGARRLRDHDRHRRGLADGRRASRRPRRRVRLRRRRPERDPRSARGRAPTRSSPSTSRRRSSSPRSRSGRPTPSSGPAGRRRPPSASSPRRAAASTTRSRPPGGPRPRAPRSCRRARGARRCSIGIPAAGRRDLAAGALDPAHGAPRPRLDLRLGPARARLPGAARASTGRGRLPLDRLITARLPLDAVGDAFGLLRGGNPGRDRARARRSGGVSARAVVPPPVATGTVVRPASPAIEVRRYAVDLDPPFRAAWDPTPRATVEETLVIVRSEDGVAGYASGDDAARRRAAGAACSSASTRCGPRRCARSSRRSTSTAGGRGRSRSRSGTSSAGSSASRCGGCSAVARSGCSPTCRRGEPVAGEERAAPRRRAARPRRAGRQAALPPRRLAPRRRGRRAVRDAVGGDVEIMVDANQGWRMAGDRSARWDVATATQCARALEPLGVYWLEEPLRTDDVEGYALLRRRTVAADRGGRDGARPVRGARPHPPRRRRRRAARRRARGRPRRLSADRRARRPLRARVLARTRGPTASACVANLHLATAVSTCPYLEVPLDPPGWTPGRRDWLLGEPRLEIAADGTIAPPPGPGPRRRARPRRARGASHRLMEIRAAVLHEAHAPLRVETVTLDPPRAGEVLVRVAAAGVCHSDVRLADGDLGDGRWPTILGHEGAGVVEAVGPGGRRARGGRPGRVLLRPAVPVVRRVRGGPLQPLRGRRGARVGGDDARRHDPAAPRRRPRHPPLQLRLVLRRALRRARRERRPDPARAAAVAGGAARLRGRHRLRCGAQRRARRARRERVRDRLRRDRPADRRRGADGGRRADRRGRPRRREARPRARAAARRTPSTRRVEDPRRRRARARPRRRRPRARGRRHARRRSGSPGT